MQKVLQRAQMFLDTMLVLNVIISPEGCHGWGRMGLAFVAYAASR